MLVISSSSRHFPGQSRALFDALTGPKDLLPFDPRLGADTHREGLARGAVDCQMGDFFAAQLAGRSQE